MARVLFLAHRLPYPPNKGDKIHTYHVLRWLARRHEVLLGTFIDDPADEVHLPVVRSLCRDVHVSRLRPRNARLRSLWGLLTREPLTMAYYRDVELARWVDTVRRERQADWLFVYSSSMLQYAKGFDLPMLIDFADVDSAKWSAYGRQHHWPMSWVYRREGRILADVERLHAAKARWSLFATSNEAELFRTVAPDSAGRIDVLGNGVDSDYFTPDPTRPSPYSRGECPLVFMGAMDYWPNVDAVTWFVREVLPSLQTRYPRVRFHIVGRSPTPAVQALSSPTVNVTGTVADVRPFVQHAAVVVAPLRLARGIQNKVLEAMAMARPVVAATSCAEAIDAEPGADLLVAATAEEYVHAISALLDAPERAAAMGAAGRQRVQAAYGWDARLADLDRFMPPTVAEGCERSA
jgi:sugar transferase (PEP-CTERM/EpsH1 system associated)